VSPRAASLTVLLVGSLAAGCQRTALELPAEEQPATVAPAGADDARCARDDDCALLPSALTCCIQCRPAPPFEPVPSRVLAGMLVQNETECAERDRACPEVRCDPIPEGCVARAACVDGRCVAVASGCDIPTS
jgi:hypothetical protein